MAAQANLDLTDDRIQDGIDHRSLSQWGYAGLAALTLTAIYFAWMPQPSLQTIHRILIPWDTVARPSEITISNIIPGDIEAHFGDALPVTVQVDGLDDDEPVRLFYRAVDGSSTGQNMLMTRSGTSTFTATIADNEPGIQQSMQYWIVAGESTKRTAQSDIFQLTAVAAPYIQVQSIQYAYPAYTQLPLTVVTDRFNIDAVEGTELTIKAESNQVIETATLYLFQPNTGEPTKRNATQIQSKTCEFQLTLKLLDDQLTPEFSHFEIVFSTVEDETTSEPIRYGIQVQADMAPKIAIESPTATELENGPIQLPLNQNLKIQFQSHDPDYGLEQIDFIIQHGDQEPIGKSLFHHTLGSEDVIRRNVVFNPQSLKIPVGSRVILFANATDNRRITARPTPNVSSSEHLVIHIVEPNQNGNSSDTTNNSSDGNNEQTNNPDTPNTPDQNDPQSDNMPEDSDGNQGESTAGEDGTGGTGGTEGEASEGEGGSDGDGQQTNKPEDPNGNQNGPELDAQGDMGNPSESPTTGNQSSESGENGGESKPTEGEPTGENMNDPTNGNTGDQGNPQEQTNQGDPDSGTDTEIGTGDSSQGTPTGEQANQGDQSNQNGRPEQETQGAKNEDLHDGEIFERILKHMRENPVPQNNKPPMNPEVGDGANSDNTQIQKDPQTPNDTGDPTTNQNNQQTPTEQENVNPNGQDSPMEPQQGATAGEDSNATNPAEASNNPETSQGDTNNPSTDPATGTGGSGTSAKTLGATDGPEESTDGSPNQQDNTGQQTSNGFAQPEGSTGTQQESQTNGGPLNDPNNQLEQSKMDQTLTEQELANLKYTRKVTDLALQYLKDKQHDPDQKLLDDLGITAEQMREMITRYEKLKTDKTPQGNQALEESLRALGLRNSKNLNPRTVNVQSENVTGVRNAGVVSGLPADLRQKFRSFRKGTNVSDD
jgi:hypothetical protein